MVAVYLEVCCKFELVHVVEYTEVPEYQIIAAIRHPNSILAISYTSAPNMSFVVKDHAVTFNVKGIGFYHHHRSCGSVIMVAPDTLTLYWFKACATHYPQIKTLLTPGHHHPK
uniref:Uncharacterized protein n=1 Tax=Pararge aegeria TaxID=116150 RepID=S4NYY1_9NEOP